MWRIASRGYAPYAVICPVCGQRRGWQRRAHAERHAADLVDAGWAAHGWRVEEYEPTGALCACACDTNTEPGVESGPAPEGKP